jgi:hypothetical protein
MTCDQKRIDILPSSVDIEIQRETTVTLEFVLTDGDGKPLNIEADTVKFTAKETPGGTATIPTKTSAAGAHLDGAGGRVEFTIEKTEIDNEANRTTKTFWVYEIRRTQPGGEEFVHISGSLVIHPDVGVS